MRKAIVYGNGESRIGHYVYGEFPNDEYVTWGCNAIYRDIDVMNLVSKRATQTKLCNQLWWN